jgi:hypothetical protein
VLERIVSSPFYFLSFFFSFFSFFLGFSSSSPSESDAARFLLCTPQQAEVGERSEFNGGEEAGERRERWGRGVEEK